MSKCTDNSEVLQSGFEYYLGGDLIILQLTGLYSIRHVFTLDQPKWPYWEVIPFIFGGGGLCFALISDIRNALGFVQTDSMLTIEIAAACFSGFLSIFKGFRIWIYRRELYDLIRLCYLRWKIQVSRNTITECMMKDAQAARHFRIIYSVIVGLLLTAYVLLPIRGYLQFYCSGSNYSFEFSETVYPANYPFTLTSVRPFFFCIALETVGIFFLGLYWLAADAVFAQITTHLAIQFQILGNDVRHICPITQMRSYGPTKIIQRLKRNIDEHLELFGYVHFLEKIYNPILLATVLINGIDLCTCLYSLQYRLAESNWGDVGKNAVHASAIVLQTLMFCACSQRLNDEIAGVRQAAYECSWTEFNTSIKTMILLIMIQTQHEYIYSAYGFIHLDMPQIFSVAMRYFTLLRTVT
ncbi:odorant receptor 13a [Diachasma alloeum]|uniref:Odorant receptor n=1 Tax=Diachasma alloeum TaxID=454923 RepID=A0A4E0S4G2_9HYME|nr:odorant receptor 13a [Diachasma alloeum]THK32993.1 odorant receptor 188S [Diachasma alloeum]